MQSYQSLNNIK